MYLLLCTASLSSGRARSLYARGRHRVGGASHTQTLERRLGVGDGLRLRRELLGGALIYLLLAHEALALDELVDLIRRQGREVDAFQLFACIVLDDQVRFFSGLEVDHKTFVGVRVARFLHEALDLLQLVELSATTRLDPSLRGERRRRDDQQPASGRGFAAAAMRANDSIDLCWLQALARIAQLSSSSKSVISCRFCASLASCNRCFAALCLHLASNIVAAAICGLKLMRSLDGSDSTLQRARVQRHGHTLAVCESWAAGTAASVDILGKTNTSRIAVRASLYVR